MREAKRLKKHYASFTDDYARLLEELHANPTLGTDLGGGLRKIRMRIASKGQGKSGGARVSLSHRDSFCGRDGNRFALHL